MILHHRCSHIRISTDLCLFATPRSFSQLVTSFVGSQCQGILHMLFFAWTTFVYWSQYTFGSLYAWIAVFFILAVKRHFLSCLLLAKLFLFTLLRKNLISFLTISFSFFPLLCLSCITNTLIRFSMNIHLIEVSLFIKLRRYLSLSSNTFEDQWSS